jgi:hypothetical protein
MGHYSIILRGVGRSVSRGQDALHAPSGRTGLVMAPPTPEVYGPISDGKQSALPSRFAGDTWV